MKEEFKGGTMADQMTFELSSAQKKTGPVTCLGLTFPDEAARRAHFTALLAEELRRQKGVE